MTLVASFDPIEGKDARILILGTMPGVASLHAGQYYAQSRNAFWKILGAILGFPSNADYVQRVDILKASGIALWDVLESCVRPGSLDSDIDMNSAKPNDIGALLRRQPKVATICFNGAAAQQCYKARVLPMLGSAQMKYLRLPSTSPAHAAMSFEEKLARWRTALGA